MGQVLRADDTLAARDAIGANINFRVGFRPAGRCHLAPMINGVRVGEGEEGEDWPSRVEAHKKHVAGAALYCPRVGRCA